MSNILLALFTVGLVLASLFLVLIILMQRASANSGLGTAIGGGAAESALGVGASNILARGTIYAVVLFFVISFGLYLGYLGTEYSPVVKDSSLPEFEAVEGELNGATDLDDSAVDQESASIEGALDAAADTLSSAFETVAETVKTVVPGSNSEHHADEDLESVDTETALEEGSIEAEATSTSSDEDEI